MGYTWETIEQKLVDNSVKYRELKATGGFMKPQAVSIAVTGRCNSRCLQCLIWQSVENNAAQAAKEMTVPELVRYFEDPACSELREIDITGGEPFLKDDLVELVCRLAELKKTHLQKLRTIIIPTNGFLTKKIISQTDTILERLQGTGLDFVSVVALDGAGTLHDLLRGREGAFNKVIATISGLLELKQKHQTPFWPGIKTTIMQGNLAVLEEILDFVETKDLFHIISPVIITKKRFCNQSIEDKITLTEKDYPAISKILANRKLENDYYYQKVLKHLDAGAKEWVCTALFNSFFVDYDRSVYPCAILNVHLGTLGVSSLSAILKSAKAASVREKINRYPSCQNCTEPGAVHYSLFMEGTLLLSFIRSRGEANYKEILVKKGMDKLL